MNNVLPNYVWIIIIVVVALIALYVLYLIASNHRFHKMVDPQLKALQEYDERRRRAARETIAQQDAQAAQAQTLQPVPPAYSQQQQAPADYTWKDQK